MSTVCSSCGGSDIEYDQARGDAVCTNCGCVLEDNIIVSEVSFAEQSSGASAVIGQFVSSEGSKVPLSGSGFHHGIGKVSREVTLAQAKKRLNNLGHMLRLNQHCIDSAFMFFKMALQMNLTRGRKSSIIDTACLYLVCRSEGTPHLLLDFSDVLQINVYSLGRAYLRLSKALHINPPAIDPCLYIHRFAHKLELGEKTHEVSMTALRLVARMKRDWIHHGRRPAGLCGAALLVAARLHNFNRSVRQVARIVKLSEGTVRKRLGDFKDTASSRLTIDEFLKIDLEQEHDPPSYLEAKRKARLKPDNKDGSAIEEVLGKDCDDSDEEEGGYGGIRNQSVEEIIAKARFTESFLTGSASIGLTDNLEELARLEDLEKEEAQEVDYGEEGLLDTTDIDDKEIEALLLSEEEVKIKSKLWFAENGDFLKQRELRMERLAAEKAEKEKNKKTRKRKPKTYHQQPFSNAGEAIGQMLVEKRLSSKINYDVLKDIDIDFQKDSKKNEPTDQTSTTVPPLNNTKVEKKVSPVGRRPSVDLTIKRQPSGNRLPSLMDRTRPLSSLAGSRSGSDMSSHPILSSSQRKRTSPASLGPSVDPKAKKMKSQPQSGVVEKQSKVGEVEPPPTPALAYNSTTTEGSKDAVVEESGPVQYYDGEEEEEDEIDELPEDLDYPDDPLNHSDYEDYED